MPRARVQRGAGGVSDFPIRGMVVENATPVRDAAGSDWEDAALKVTTALLVIALVWTCYRLGVVENERYALLTNLCLDKVGASAPDLACVRTVQTRSPWLLNVYYGVTGG